MKRFSFAIALCLILAVVLPWAAFAQDIVPMASTTIKNAEVILREASGKMCATAKLNTRGVADELRISGLKIQRRAKGSKDAWEKAASLPTVSGTNKLLLSAEVTCKHDPAYEYRAYAKFYAKIGEKSDSIGKYTGIK